MSSTLLKRLQKAYKIEFCKRYRNFIETEEYKKYNGKPGPELHAANGLHSKYKVNFSNTDSLIDYFWDAMSDGGNEIPEDPRLVPLSTLGNDGGSYFLSVDVENEEAPVYVWDEGSCEMVYSSLDDFLEAINNYSSKKEE